MRASVRLGWRVAAIAAFAATAALAVTLTRGGSEHAALTSAKHVTKQRAAAGAPRCAASRLRISVGIAAGTGPSALRVTWYRLDFTNVSGVTCTLSGYPEVAAYRGDGAQVGNEAGRDTSVAARHIVLAPGASAHAAVTASVSRGRCRRRCQPRSAAWAWHIGARPRRRAVWSRSWRTSAPRASNRPG